MDLTLNLTEASWPELSYTGVTNSPDLFEATIRTTQAPVAEWKWYGYTMKYGPVIMWVFGSVSNVMAFIMFLKKGIRESVTALLFRILAIADFFTVQETLTIWVQNFLGQESTALHTWGCRMAFFLWKSSKTLSAWILVGVAVERYIGVCYPHRAKTLVTKKRAKICLIVITCASLLWYIPCLLMYKNYSLWSPGLQRIDFLCLRTGVKKYAHFARNIFPWLEFVVMSGLPFIIMILLNSVIVVTLIKAARLRHMTTSGDAKGPDTSSMTAMLLGVSIAFILLTTPMFVYFMAYQFTALENNQNLRGRFRLLFGVAFNLQHLNYSINFFLYCLTGKKFREETIKTFFFWCRRGTPNQNANSSRSFRSQQTSEIKHISETASKAIEKA